jgi:hypothetical protein
MYLILFAVLGIRDILVRIRIRIRIPGSVPLDPDTAPDPDPYTTPDPTSFFIDFEDAKKVIFLYFFI